MAQAIADGSFLRNQKEPVIKLMTKMCPFCKKHIDKSAAQCPHCKRILIEYVGNRNFVPNVSDKLHKNTLINTVKRTMVLFSKRILSILSGITHFRLNKHSFNLNYLWLIPLVIFIILVASGHAGNVTKTSTSTKETSLPTNYNRLSNGSVLSSRIGGNSGLGTLEIDNGTDDDAIVKLTNAKIGTSLFTVYVQANSKFTIRSIPDGIYELYFQAGKDWDDKTRKFLYYPSFSKFSDDFQYTTTHTETDDAINTRYATYKITLNPVVGGTAKTITIAESEFEKY